MKPASKSIVSRKDEFGRLRPKQVERIRRLPIAPCRQGENWPSAANTGLIRKHLRHGWTACGKMRKTRDTSFLQGLKPREHAVVLALKRRPREEKKTLSATVKAAPWRWRQAPDVTCGATSWARRCARSA